MFTLVKNIVQNLLRRPATRPYPAQRRASFAGTRGLLCIDPAVCIYCGVCAKRCPAQAIAVSRDPKRWTIDPYRCILCSYCVEVCPKHCLFMQARHGDFNSG